MDRCCPPAARVSDLGCVWVCVGVRSRASRLSANLRPAPAPPRPPCVCVESTQGTVVWPQHSPVWPQHSSVWFQHNSNLLTGNYSLATGNGEAGKRGIGHERGRQSTKRAETDIYESPAPQERPRSLPAPFRGPWGPQGPKKARALLLGLGLYLGTLTRIPPRLRGGGYHLW